MKTSIFYILIISVIFAFDDTTKILVLKPYSTIDPIHIDEGDIGTINMLFIESLNQYMNKIQISAVSCNDDSCALTELAKTMNNQFVVYTRLQKLGSKIIFSGSILDANTSFNSKSTAMNIEDMENVCSRLAKSIALQESISDVIDINNIVEQESKEPIRRASISRIGFAGGYIYPLNDTFGDGPGSRTLNLSSIYYYEFDNNSALIVDAMMAGISFGAHLGFLKYTNILDSSPFYGLGLGLHRTLSFNDDIESSSGPSINLQAGVMLFRTYDINVLFRGKYLHVFNDSSDNGFIIDIGIQKKRNENKKSDRFGIFKVF